MRPFMKKVFSATGTDGASEEVVVGFVDDGVGVAGGLDDALSGEPRSW